MIDGYESSTTESEGILQDNGSEDFAEWEESVTAESGVESVAESSWEGSESVREVITPLTLVPDEGNLSGFTEVGALGMKYAGILIMTSLGICFILKLFKSI